MTTPSPDRGNATVDLTAAPRAILRESVRLLSLVIGEERLGSARENAWAAVCADRARAQQREEAHKILADVRARRG